MTQPDDLRVALAALDLVARRSRDPEPALVSLVRIAGSLLGVTAGAEIRSGAVSARSVHVGHDDETLGRVVGAGFTSGPARECATSGRAVSCERLESARPRWLGFVVKALDAGVTGAWALPIRHDDGTGALLLLGHAGRLPDLAVAQVLADATTIAIRAGDEADRAAQEVRHLQTALQSRVVIDQATGIVAGHTRLPVDEAFGLLRGHARRGSRGLADLSREIVDGSIDPASIVGPASSGHRRTRRPSNGSSR
ncbi:ANTAR domain-containing protein [Pseudonocardia endophytica]|uniref:ANTAR domain-containing protein n=1 Tax=Pseudonocardia endophytica TaxID=401976 RepID=A0A4R1HWG9_PSEEN|nr:ANTAR domain-containing protein [Pseudonocardia endophytica]TCK25813.1 ANTAR domain-containing protein [Pseudonocardia endophytica]